MIPGGARNENQWLPEHPLRELRGNQYAAKAVDSKPYQKPQWTAVRQARVGDAGRDRWNYVHRCLLHVNRAERAGDETSGPCLCQAYGLLMFSEPLTPFGKNPPCVTPSLFK